MLETIIAINKKEAYAQLPFQSKFYKFWMDKKRRFFYVFMAYIFYHYDCYNRTRKWYAIKRYRVINKYQKRWILRFNPDKFIYPAAGDNLRLPRAITEENYMKLGRVFIEVERQLLFGVSRQLIINVLMKMERMDTKMAATFLSDSGYSKARARTLHSCELYELCQLLESILKRIQNDKTDEQNQNELIDGFVDLLPKEVKNFEDNIEAVITEMEKKARDNR